MNFSRGYRSSKSEKRTRRNSHLREFRKCDRILGISAVLGDWLFQSDTKKATRRPPFLRSVKHQL